MSKHHRHRRDSSRSDNSNSSQSNNVDNNPLAQMINGNTGNPLMGLLSSFLTGGNGGGGNMFEELLSGLGGKDNNMLGNLMNGLGGQNNNMLGNLMGGMGGQDNNMLGNLMGSMGGQDNNMLGNLMSSLNSQQGNDIISNLMNNANSGNANSKNLSTRNGNSGNVSSGNVSSSNKKAVAKVVKNNIDDFDKNNYAPDSDEDDYEQGNPLSNLFSGAGSIDLSQISNMLAGIDFNNLDLNNTNISEMINTISNNSSFESNDVEFKHTNPKERTHNILENLEHEDAGQLIYILAHLVDDKKLEMLNKIVEENSK